MLDGVNAWRNIEKLQRGARVHLYDASHEVQVVIQKILAATLAGRDVGFDELDPATRDKLVGKEIGAAISQKRLEVIKELNLFPS